MTYAMPLPTEPDVRLQPDLQMAAADINEDDIQAVMGVLRSGRLALGDWAGIFEQRVAEFVGVRHAICVNSGTAALHLIVRGLGLGPGDEVIVPSFTFAASVNALLYEGVTPVFADITPDTFNLDPADVRARVTPRTRAVMVVDVFGHPAPWAELEQVAEEFNLMLLDDCCEALGSAIGERRLGSLGRAGAFAFYPNKQITSGEGGMIVTNDDQLAQAARSMANQGRPAMGAWLEHERLGFNYRLDEMSAALGASQMQRLPQLLARRREVAALYTRRLAPLPNVRVPVTRPGVVVSPFVYVVTLTGTAPHRDEVMKRLAAQGVPSRGYFAPLHQQPYMQGYAAPACLPVTEDVCARTIALPFHHQLGEADIERIAQALQVAVAVS
ncbi:DegT/DnrJ/EryC1/StrS family aminotransferase [Deinococcus radiotolerans]|uniref:Polysaccharide biosynthesis protein n=1 Tax=Deinococcus radiotolerans TaxID=1309407 RepID=A0ABQ2FMX9_9DEIO|nr:DegT/DnrJ/EryC1/StrS family aminotransferase [Deinococcus radiotolerans]GGL09644.1 polysaccharide biosynthesis protein [Deinococcus radiotolerans]